MQKNIFTILFLLFTCNAFAQKVVLSEKENLNFRNDDFMVIGKCRTYTTVYKNHDGVAEILFYSQNFIKEKISTLRFMPSSTLKVYFANTKNELIALYVEKENKKLNVYASKLNEDYTWSEPLLLDSSPSISYRYSTEYNFCSSEDKTKTLFYRSYIEDGVTILQAKLIDQNLNILTQSKQNLENNEVGISDIGTVSNAGHSFIIAQDFKNSRGSTDKLILLTATLGATSFKPNSFKLNENSVSDIHIAIDNSHKNLYICGYFSDGKYASPRGIYYSSFNFENNLLNTSYFSPLTLQVSSSSRTDLRNLKIRNVFIKKTGEIEIVAEKAYQTTRTVGNTNPMLSSSYLMSTMQENSRTVNEFSYDEIVVFNLKIDGAMAWSQTILKEQTTIDDNGIFSSYGLLQHRLGNAYIFSDVSNKQSRLLTCYVSGNGELLVKELQTTEDANDWSIMPRSAVQISKSEIVMPCVSKNYLCFLKISY